MKPYPKYTTTIGAYSIPDWYESLDRLVSFGHLSMAAMADARFRAGEAAIHDQELADIDVITGGEMHRRTHNRHSPPNAMLNYFWQKILGFQGEFRHDQGAAFRYSLAKSASGSIFCTGSCANAQRNAAKTDHFARPECISSGGDMPGGDPEQHRPWPGRRI
jgi:methionine synthase II (cobalamin-independent)